jgi:hypothetical protein
MSLHIIKLCVGVSEIAEMKAWAKLAKGTGEELDHVTRAYPKREAEIIPGGSLYWVIRGMILCRQPIARFEKQMGADGIERCRIVFEPKIIPVRPMPRRAFQGWRYLEGADAPPDLAAAGPGQSEMPEQMKRELAALGLL